MPIVPEKEAAGKTEVKWCFCPFSIEQQRNLCFTKSFTRTYGLRWRHGRMEG
jgi:hypothetical protein